MSYSFLILPAFLRACNTKSNIMQNIRELPLLMPQVWEQMRLERRGIVFVTDGALSRHVHHEFARHGTIIVRGVPIVPVIGGMHLAIKALRGFTRRYSGVLADAMLTAAQVGQATQRRLRDKGDMRFHANLVLVCTIVEALSQHVLVASSCAPVSSAAELDPAPSFDGDADLPVLAAARDDLARLGALRGIGLMYDVMQYEDLVDASRVLVRVGKLPAGLSRDLSRELESKPVASVEQIAASLLCGELRVVRLACSPFHFVSRNSLAALPHLRATPRRPPRVQMAEAATTAAAATAASTTARVRTSTARRLQCGARRQQSKRLRSAARPARCRRWHASLTTHSLPVGPCSTSLRSPGAATPVSGCPRCANSKPSATSC